MTEKPRTKLTGELLLVLTICAICSLAIWFPLAKYNLPVAANVDERTGWSIIANFYTGDLNPHFFLYPTLYYYLDYLITRPFGIHNILFSGRILNLILVAASAMATYFLALSVMRKRLAGTVAATFVVCSPLFAASGSYLCTDVLLAVLSIASLTFMLRYLEGHLTLDWFAGMVLCGLSVGCKYTAFILFIAYVFVEVGGSPLEDGDQPRTWLLAWRVSKSCLVPLVLGAGILFCSVAVFFPFHWAMTFIQTHRTNVNGKSAAGYLLFFRALRIQFTLLGVGSLALGLLLARFDDIWRRISPVRLYLGLGIVGAVFLLTTPFSVISPFRFLYDVGAVLKNNVDVPHGHSQWSNYLRWFIANESWVIGVLAIAGGILLLKNWPRLRLLYIYSALYILAIGASHRGFPRYLVPLLPILFCLAGYAVAVLVQSRQGRWIAACIFVPLIFWYVVHIRQVRRAAKRTDDVYSAYMLTNSARPRKVYFAGMAPSEELKNEGYQVQEVSWKEVVSPEFWNELECRDVVILDLRNPDPGIVGQDSKTIKVNSAAWKHLDGNASSSTEGVYLKDACN